MGVGRVGVEGGSRSAGRGRVVDELRLRVDGGPVDGRLKVVLVVLLRVRRLDAKLWLRLTLQSKGRRREGRLARGSRTGLELHARRSRLPLRLGRRLEEDVARDHALGDLLEDGRDGEGVVEVDEGCKRLGVLLHRVLVDSVGVLADVIEAGEGAAAVAYKGSFASVLAVERKRGGISASSIVGTPSRSRIERKEHSPNVSSQVLAPSEDHLAVEPRALELGRRGLARHRRGVGVGGWWVERAGRAMANRRRLERVGLVVKRGGWEQLSSPRPREWWCENERESLASGRGSSSVARIEICLR